MSKFIAPFTPEDIAIFQGLSDASKVALGLSCCELASSSLTARKRVSLTRAQRLAAVLPARPGQSIFVWTQRTYCGSVLRYALIDNVLYLWHGDGDPGHDGRGLRGWNASRILR